MTRPSRRELEREVDDLEERAGVSESGFVRQCVAVLNEDRDAVDASPPSDTNGGELVIQVSEAAGVSPVDAWQIVEEAGGDPELLADFDT